MNKVVCTEQVPVGVPAEHAHIVAIGTTQTNGLRADNKWTLEETIQAIDKGVVFYTVSPSTGKVAKVEKVVCPHCRTKWIIRSTPDAVVDNNLDNLRFCQWQ